MQFTLDLHVLEALILSLLEITQLILDPIVQHLLFVDVDVLGAELFRCNVIVIVDEAATGEAAPVDYIHTSQLILQFMVLLC